MCVMNKVFLMGRLTADPELRQVQSGVAVTTFTIAVDRRYSKDGQRQTDFIRCTAWRQQAEFICKYFRKGSMILVIGNIQTRSWDGQDGKKQFATDVVIDEVHFTGSRAETGGQSGTQSMGRPAPAANNSDFDSFEAMDFAGNSGNDLPFEDDLPF